MRFWVPKDNEKFYEIQPCLSSLSPKYAVEVRDLLRNVPNDQPYEKLKVSLRERTVESSRVQLNRLLQWEQLGERKITKLAEGLNN